MHIKSPTELNIINNFRINQQSNVIMHIDYDSFFASVEQQNNPLLRDKPIVVGGSSMKKGIVCAASIEAKKLGIKTGMPLFKAKVLCPNLISVRGDGSKYSYIQKESLKIFNKYTDLVEPFSIDEAFLDVTKTLKFFGTPKELALIIKKDILNTFGKYITCSIGIGPNKLVAKLVSDLDKPNGIVEVTKDNIESILRSVGLKDFCGIGPKTEEHLNKIGIFTVEQLQKTDLNHLYKEFGNVSGSFLKSLSYGVGTSNVKSMDYHRPVKSISHQHTLMKNTKNTKILLTNIRRLCEMVAKRMRNNNMICRTIHLSLRDSNRKSYEFRTTLYKPTASGLVIYYEVEKLLTESKWKKETRLVGIGVSNLLNAKNYMQPLFLEDQKDDMINKTIDKINDKFGKFTIIPASTLKADNTKKKISSFLKHE